MHKVNLKFGQVDSSSVISFLIYGACFGEDDLGLLIEAATKLGLNVPKQDDINLYDLLPDIAAVLELEDHYGCKCKHSYIGLSPYLIRDDETGGQFKTRVEKKIAEAFGEGIRYAYYEEVFRGDLEANSENE